MDLSDALSHPKSDIEHRNNVLQSKETVQNLQPAVHSPGERLTQPEVSFDTEVEALDVPSPSTNSSYTFVPHNDSMEMDDNEEEDNDEDNDDDEEEEEEDDEDDNSSELSKGDNLIKDLQESLEGDFDFKGSFSYSATMPDAPNPILTIDGLGHIGLPLSERDAKAIIECSAQAPFGKGEDTVIDKEVRDTWEIEPSKISFGNPLWVPWIKNLARTTIWQALGVVPYSKQPRCDLYKLLLYEPGSHFLPHQDTQKANGMFATVIVLLPSPYTGGQVHVTHSSVTSVIDLASSSMLSTSILAWYTDVMHEVKPVTSGYRLALSYNLIHTSPNVPRPTLPNMHAAVDALRRVLRKWKEDMYMKVPKVPLIAYLLRHEYSQFNLGGGMNSLKGADAHKVSNLMPVAEKLGFKVCLANLACQISGTADDDFGCKRGRYWGDSDEDEDEDETPSMMEVNSKEFDLSNLSDVHGHHPLGSQKFPLQEECLIPQDAFDGEEPDDTEYEGYMGNGAGQLDYWYHRTVLVLYHKSREFDIMFHHGGAQYGLSKLNASSSIPPSAEDKKIAAAILRVMKSNDKQIAIGLIDFATKWVDVETWKQVVVKCGYALDIFGTQKIVDALGSFTFESLRESFQEMLTRCVKLQGRLGFIDEVLNRSPTDDAIKAWCEDQSSKALSSYNSALVDDIPTLILVARGRGLACIADIILPNLMKKPLAYEFWIAFVKSLCNNRKDLVKTEKAEATTNVISPVAAEDPVNNLIEKCLETAVAQWDAIVAQPAGYYHALQNHQSAADGRKVARIIDLVELCLITKCIPPCYKLFVHVLKAKGDIATKIGGIYTPLIPKLNEVLKKWNVDICERPFNDLMRAFVVSYLGNMLGSKPRTGLIKLRKLGCGCSDCTVLDNFMNNPDAECTFRMHQRNRSHLETRLNTARDLCTHRTIRSGTPHTLIVTKLPEVLSAITWNDRQKKARIFLGLIGTDATLARLMGDQYADVLKALEGSQPFPKTSARKVGNSSALAKQPLSVTAAQAAAGIGQISSLAAGSGQPTGVVSSSSTANPTQSIPEGFPRNQTTDIPAHPVAGIKRKKGPAGVQLGPVIDLTEEDT